MRKLLEIGGLEWLRNFAHVFFIIFILHCGLGMLECDTSYLLVILF